jgi:putative tryptophan/tyrosine transport system substrate-binding protein
MRRRDFIILMGNAAASLPFAARAQQSERVRLIGVLMAYAENDLNARNQLAVFRGALKKLGWTDGDNLRIEVRWGGGSADRIAISANELVELRPDAVLGVTTPAIGALALKTKTIPLVFNLVADPIGNGLGASLAHPGSNITGAAAYDPAVAGKWVELLKQIAPQAKRVALLFNPATASPLQLYMPSIQAAAASLAVEVSAAPVRARNEIEGTIAAQSPNGIVVVMPDAFNIANRDSIIALAAHYAVPTIYNATFYAKSGGLIAYGAAFDESFSQAAEYIDRILKGAKPGDLPIQLPTKYELVINLKTANALGLTVPHNLLVLADEVIE